MRSTVLLFCIGFLFSTITDGLAQQPIYEGQPKRARNADSHSATNPHDPSPASSYPAQRREKENQQRMEEEATEKRKVCELSSSRLCTNQYTRQTSKCAAAEARCRATNSDDDDEGANCVAQKCELEKAGCLSEAAQDYESCLQSVISTD